MTETNRSSPSSSTAPATWGTDPTYPVQTSWAEIRSRLRKEWRPGEHFSILATTGGGKTHLAIRGLLPQWRWVLVLDAKGGDRVLDHSGYKRVRSYPSKLDTFKANGDRVTRFRVHPGTFGAGSRSAFDEVFRRVWSSARGSRDGTWIMYADETRLLTGAEYLGLGAHLDAVWISGRSRGITLLAASQAPRFLPSSFYEQPTYHAIGRVRDRRAIRRLGEIGGDTDILADVVPKLGDHEFLILGPRWAAITKVA